MTQSGQGDDQQPPAGRPAHEGVVLPPDGGAPWNPAADGRPQEPAPGGPPWDGQAWGSQAPQQQHPGDPAQGQQPGPYAQQGGYPQQDGYPQQGGYAQPDPYQQAQQTQYLPASDGYRGGQPDAYQQQGQQVPPAQPQPYAQPLPPEAVPGRAPGGDSDATQFIAPVPAARDGDATQYIPPATAAAPYDIRPGAPEDRRPPAEFDNLFRNDEPAGATTQMPRIDPAHQQPPAHQQYGRPQGPPQPHGQGYPGGQLPPQTQQQGYAPGYQGPQGYENPQAAYDPGPEPRRRSAHIPLIAAVVIGCAVVGLGAGALLSGGDEPKDAKQPVASASSQPADSSAPPAEDPAQPQAVELDKLLADSNSSRTTVINAVEKIKGCKDLDQAAADLTGAAQQRRDLVTRLKEVEVDRLPDNAALTAALTRGWEASASADEHYAAWARQAKNKKVCKSGTAAATNEKNKAGQKSGEATTAKKQASGLWNTIAQKYGLTSRSYTEL
ncbi:hypothetical protein [Streptomyces sp. AM 2-1-1]|uniref:hypothetical protein n=1 Tax=Streptomyces sp. AM 2-1-1 TaxID=3028709 RepID=UPI0023B8DF9F|nr:hypothetical protein [Streptomyces sp. AM 2-1-1]WEH41302.1 hypothetical protein PZB77_18355 [Streptomyces sp. AM 2-1-1]